MIVACVLALIVPLALAVKDLLSSKLKVVATRFGHKTQVMFGLNMLAAGLFMFLCDIVHVISFRFLELFAP